MKKLFKGSALVYTLIMMMLLLVTALSLATTTLIQQRGATGTAESVQAFQLANDGFEDITARYTKGGASTIGDTAGTGGTGSCTNGSVTNDIVTGRYTATFKDSDGNPIASCITPLSNVSEVKIVATKGSSTRAIETAFAAGGGDPSCIDIFDEAVDIYNLTATPSSQTDDETVKTVCCQLNGDCQAFMGGLGTVGTPKYGKWFDIVDISSSSISQLSCAPIAGNILDYIGYSFGADENEHANIMTCCLSDGTCKTLSNVINTSGTPNTYYGKWVNLPGKVFSDGNTEGMSCYQLNGNWEDLQPTQTVVPHSPESNARFACCRNNGDCVGFFTTRNGSVLSYEWKSIDSL